jgi:hypothetical protein
MRRAWERAETRPAQRANLYESSGKAGVYLFVIDPAINYVMPECFRRASIPLDSRLRGNDGLDI